MLKDGLHTTSHATWACHLYPVTMATLPVMQGLMYKQFKLLITTKQVPLDNFFTNFLLINSNSIKHTNSIDQI